MKLISFSLYGTHPIYLQGSVINLRMIEDFFPGWRCRFYVSQEISHHHLQILREGGGEVISMVRTGVIDGMFWRFLAAAEPDLEALLVRDCDSRFTQREKLCVQQWMESGRGFHIMRDHPEHGTPILGGMWGCRGGILNNMPQLINRWRRFRKLTLRGWDHRKGMDQVFLAQSVYPRIRRNVLIHSNIIRYKGEETVAIPGTWSPDHFIGRPYDATSD